MGEEIARRADADPREGARKYGDVLFADPVNHKYPIDSWGHVRAAWKYIHEERNAAKYSVDDLNTMKERIRQAAEQYKVRLLPDGELDPPWDI